MSVIFSSLLHGFLLSLAMIMAIGAQNAFILKQGIKGEHVLFACLICALSDATLIVIGSFGLGTFIASNNVLQLVMTVVGSAFLFYYSYTAFKQFLASEEEHKLLSQEESMVALKKVLLMALAFSFLNPHAWLDTVVVIGSVSGQYENLHEHAAFTIGACIVSFLWFFLLGFLAKTFRKYLLLHKVQKGINLFIAVLMASISISLIRNGLSML